MESSDWLATFLKSATHECTRIHCTTCGSMPFRRGLLKSMGRMSRPREWRYNYGEAEAIEVTKALATLKPEPEISHDQVMLMVFDACAVLGESEVAQRLGTSWAGSVLATMQAHYAEQVDRRRRHEEFNSPEAAAERCRLREQRKMARLAERKATKLEIDARWRESQFGDTA